MIQETLRNCTFLEEKIQNLLIPIERVAHVQQYNSLEHALLVLVKSGYTAIPVLDKGTKLNGVISKSLILDSILGLERIELDRLNNFKVADVMESKVATMRLSETFSKALALSINNPFICMTDDEGTLKGLLTRRSLLVYLNQEMFQKK